MAKVLIAIDYAQNAQLVAEQGYELATMMQAETILLHVVEDLEYYSLSSYDPIMGFGGFANMNSLNINNIETIERGAAFFLEKVKEHLHDASIETIVVSGQIANAILKIAQKENCDFIVMGKHSRSGIEGILLGSAAHKVLKKTKIPIVIIPD